MPWKKFKIKWSIGFYAVLYFLHSFKLNLFFFKNNMNFLTNMFFQR